MSLLNVQGLSHSFGGLKAVSNFNVTLDPGELVAVIGPNGAGKTTVFNLLTGVYKADAGNVTLEGRDLVGLPTHRIVASGVSRTFQNIRLFRELSVLDNVRVAHYSRSRASLLHMLLRTPHCRREEARVRVSSEALLEEFGLADVIHASASSLPYGRQRRLEIARALASRPRLLLLDEPAAGMNPHEAEDMMRLILHIRDKYKLTILLIEHQMRVVMGAAERIIVLHFGETIAEGTPEDIRSHPAVIEAYLGREDTA